MKSMDCKMYYTVDSIIAKVARVIWVKNMWYIHQHILVKEKKIEVNKMLVTVVKS